MKKIVLLSVAIMATFFVHAQQHAEAYLRSHPVWIDLMKDPDVQYDEAVKAFDLFWQNRPLRVGEHELMSASDADKASGKLLAEKKSRNAESDAYAFEYRQFKRWMIKNEPFVKADGTLYTAEERVALWKEQQQNRK